MLVLSGARKISAVHSPSNLLWTQLAFFNRDEYRVKRFRPSKADNARGNLGSRLLVAGGIVLDREGRVLLIHRSSNDLTQWEIPGGKLERGETPRETAIRELQEELGVSVQVDKDLGWYDFQFNGQSIRYALYAMRIMHGYPQPLEAKFDVCEFLHWNQIYGLQPTASVSVGVMVQRYYKGQLPLSDVSTRR